MEIKEVASLAGKLRENVKKVIIGKDEVIDKVTLCLFCGGHILLEDIPGTGKTTMAKAFARSIDSDFARVQFTPDLLPSELTGINYYNQKEGAFEFKPGSVFTNILLGDEINRATPRTQSALLECMEEGQVSVDGKTYPLEKPFLVIATQNPVEIQGTFPLPEAQLDRFFMRVNLGYPTPEEEADILERFTGGAHPMEELRPICSAQDVVDLQEQVSQVYSSKEVRAYISQIAQASRKNPSLQLGVSTRGAIFLLRGAQARALLQGRDFVAPEDVQKMVLPVLAHRVILSPEARMRGMTAERVLSGVIGSVQVPVRR